jgi:hypothetical protein
VALERYEEIMLPFAKNSQGGNSAMQLLNPQTQWGIRIRNAIFWFVTWTKLDRLALALSAALGFTEKGAPVPDYQWPAKLSVTNMCLTHPRRNHPEPPPGFKASYMKMISLLTRKANIRISPLVTGI